MTTLAELGEISKGLPSALKAQHLQGGKLVMPPRYQVAGKGGPGTGIEDRLKRKMYGQSAGRQIASGARKSPYRSQQVNETITRGKLARSENPQKSGGF
jgi:hypothetical protein